MSLMIDKHVLFESLDKTYIWKEEDLDKLIEVSNDVIAVFRGKKLTYAEAVEALRMSKLFLSVLTTTDFYESTSENDYHENTTTKTIVDEVVRTIAADLENCLDHLKQAEIKENIQMEKPYFPLIDKVRKTTEKKEVLQLLLSCDWVLIRKYILSNSDTEYMLGRLGRKTYEDREPAVKLDHYINS